MGVGGEGGTCTGEARGARREYDEERGRCENPENESEDGWGEEVGCRVVERWGAEGECVPKGEVGGEGLAVRGWR